MSRVGHAKWNDNAWNHHWSRRPDDQFHFRSAVRDLGLRRDDRRARRALFEDNRRRHRREVSVQTWPYRR